MILCHIKMSPKIWLVPIQNLLHTPISFFPFFFPFSSWIIHLSYSAFLLKSSKIIVNIIDDQFFIVKQFLFFHIHPFGIKQEKYT